MGNSEAEPGAPGIGYTTVVVPDREWDDDGLFRIEQAYWTGTAWELRPIE